MKNFILVNNEFGYPIYPEIGKGGLAETTDNLSDTPVYSEGDNARVKIAFWSAACGIQFQTQTV